MNRFGLLVSFATITIAYTSFTQSTLPKKTADSLWSVWQDESQPDAERIKAINRYSSKGYLQTQPDSALYFSGLMYDFAQLKGLKREMAGALQMQGLALDKLGDYYGAIEHYQRGLTIFEALGADKDIANLQTNISNIYRNLGEYTIALEYNIKSLHLQEKIQNPQGICRALNSIGLVYQYQGNYTKALDHYQRSLIIAEEINFQEGVSANLNNLANIYYYLGEYSRAMEYHTKNLTLKEGAGDKLGIAMSLNNIGILFKQQAEEFYSAQNYELATQQYNLVLEYYTKSLAILEDIANEKNIASSLHNIGTIYSDLAAHEMQHGNSTAGIEKFNTALSYFTKSLDMRRQMNDQQSIAASMINMGHVYRRQEQYPAAYELYLEAFQIAESIGAMEVLQTSSRALFLVHTLTDSTQHAEFYLNYLIDLRKNDLLINYTSLSEGEKENYFAEMQEDFYLQYDFAVAHPELTDQAEHAFNNALLTKGLMLKSSTAMRQSILNSDDSTLISQYYEWLTLRNQISKVYAKGLPVNDLEEKSRAIEKELVKKSGAFSDMKKAQQITWKDIQLQLAPDVAAIEFVHFKSELDSAHPTIYAALIVKPNSAYPEIVRLCTETDLSAILGVFQGNNLSFVENVYGKKSDAKTALYEKIWQPLEPFLKDVKTVHYSPSGLLHKVSFATLCKKQDVFLSDIFNLRQTGSTGNLTFERDSKFGELENFLLMGGVNYNSDSTEKKVWDYLPGSLAETNAINNYLQRKKFGVNYFKENNANEATFKEKISSTSIVHIATHGFFFPDPQQVREEMIANSESTKDIQFRGTTDYANWSFISNKNPLMRSGIVLAGANNVWSRTATDNGEDGILTALEVSNLDLRSTKLVVLSACETGLGDIKGSEGVYGLQRAFKMAGANYLIMSLWQVPDKETAEFMQLFYTNLIKVKDIPLAFQKTQQVMRKKYDPYYWGAFVLIE